MASAWEDWYVDIALGKVKCLSCDSVFAKKPARMLSHLGYKGPFGIRDKGVSLCKKSTFQIRGLFSSCGGTPPKRPSRDHSDECGTPRAGNTNVMELGTPHSTDRESCEGPMQIPIQRSTSNTTETTASRRHSTEVTERDIAIGRGGRPLRQSDISEGFQEEKRRELDKLWAKVFYEANIPFSIARNSTFKEAIRRTSDFRAPYAPPSYNDLRKKLLVQAKKELGAVLEEKVGDSVRKFGATLAFDGWSSCTNQPLFNAMIVSPAGEHFLGSVDTSGHKKTAEYQASIIEKYIEEIGPKNVVQIATDNASVMKAAADIITAKYGHIYFQGCAVHAMNLLLGDLAKARWIIDVLKKAKTIVKFIKKRHMPLAVFQKHEKKFSLVMSGKTRFGSNFLMVDRLVRVRQALQQSVVDEQWISYVSGLRDTSKKKPRTISRDVKKYVLDDHFWERCTNFQEVVAPVMNALRDFDSGEPCMGKIRHIFRNVEKHIHSVREEFFEINDEETIDVEKHFRERWALVKTDLHDAGALLNPYLLHDKELADDLDAITACKSVLGRLCSPKTYPDVVLEFLAFRHKQPPFHNMLDPKQQKCSAHAWWDFEGACGKLIAPIARRILAQTVSSSSCERNWSSYSFVHNRSRNRLQKKRAEDLVYVYTNSRLMAKAKATDEKKWYKENVSSEDSDSASEEEDGDAWMVNHADDDDGCANVTVDDPMDDWIQLSNEERLETFPTRYGQSSKHVYDFVDDGEDGNHVQASKDDNTCVNDTEENNSARELIEEERNTSGEAGRTRIEKMQEGTSKHLKDVELEITNARNSTMVNNASLKRKAIEEQFGPISKSPLKFVDGYSSRFEDQNQRTTIASRSLFDNSKRSTSRVAPTSSMGLVSLSRALHGRIGESDVDSESDGNLPLAVAIIKKHSGVPPRHNHRSFDKRMHTEIAGGDSVLISSVEKIGCSADGNRKRKRPMQPFAISPPKTEVPAKTPLDARGSMRKMKTIQPTFTGTKESKFYFVNDEESCDPEESSGAEVKGDSDYKED